MRNCDISSLKWRDGKWLDFLKIQVSYQKVLMKQLTIKQRKKKWEFIGMLVGTLGTNLIANKLVD